jgi:NADH:ubiquinone oxidoreductase subunit
MNDHGNNWHQTFYTSGKDALDNTYYQKRGDSTVRWVIYKGEDEASKATSEWHGWLHNTNEQPPQPREPYAWEQAHQPNHTGTTAAYRPKGHILSGGKRAAATGDYEAWQPENKSTQG